MPIIIYPRLGTLYVASIISGIEGGNKEGKKKRSSECKLSQTACHVHVHGPVAAELRGTCTVCTFLGKVDCAVFLFEGQMPHLCVCVCVCVCVLSLIHI